MHSVDMKPPVLCQCFNEFCLYDCIFLFFSHNSGLTSVACTSRFPQNHRRRVYHLRISSVYGWHSAKTSRISGNENNRRLSKKGMFMSIYKTNHILIPLNSTLLSHKYNVHQCAVKHQYLKCELSLNEIPFNPVKPAYRLTAL